MNTDGRHAKAWTPNTDLGMRPASRLTQHARRMRSRNQQTNKVTNGAHGVTRPTLKVILLQRSKIKRMPDNATTAVTDRRYRPCEPRMAQMNRD